MLSDILNDIGYATFVVSLVILFIATYRAFGIGRVLVRGVYRNRAYWIGATAIVLILLAVGSTLPSSNPLGAVTFIVAFVVLVVFVDTSIRVAREADFFHRSALGWDRVRKPFAALLSASVAVVLVTIALYGVNPSSGNSAAELGILQVFVVVGVMLSWGAAALTVGARRSADMTLRKFAKMLGLTVLCLVLFFTIWIPFAPFSVTVQDLGSTISDFFFPAAAYFLYRAVMSLSPVGHIQKEADASPNAAASGLAPPSVP